MVFKTGSGGNEEQITVLARNLRKKTLISMKRLEASCPLTHIRKKKSTKKNWKYFYYYY